MQVLVSECRTSRIDSPNNAGQLTARVVVEIRFAEATIKDLQ